MGMSMDESLPRLYLISPGRHGQDFDLVEAARLAFEGGARMLQVRERHLKDRPLADLVAALLEVARPYGARLFVNAGNGEGIRVARRLKTGVHLGAAWPVAGVRRELQGLVVGASSHDGEALARAAAGGADFATLSPIFMPPHKPHVTALGAEAFRAAVAGIRIPVYALGGILPETVPAAMAAGAYGVAAVSYVFDPEWDSSRAAGTGAGASSVDPRSPAERVRRLLEALPRETTTS
jgi:thiamine-phosphate pyrophosphorylase